jgi:CheY-like chemotaxis protein
LRGRILIVDPEDTVHDLLGLTLGTEFELVHARDTERALRLASDVDLVLLDLFLPDRHRLELCRRLKSAPATSHVPVVVLSAYGGKGPRQRARLAGADRFLEKPFSLLALRDALLEAFRAQAARPRRGGESPLPLGEG